MTGYCILVTSGKSPSIRIVFKPTLPEALKAIPKIKAESEGKIDVLKIVDGDTKPIREENDNEFVEDGD